jgi:hypothetical protein
MGPIFSVLDFLNPEDDIERLFRNVRKDLPLQRCETTQKSADLIYIAAEAWNYAGFSWFSNNKCDTHATQDLEVKGHNC